MATWNSDNIILTAKGREVLSKVQAGEGKINVSRIVTGAWYVPESQLYLQTLVTNETQEMDILEVDTDSSGSAIEVSINNLNLTTPYSLYQIGIYVTHQDFEGEILYVIAQCDPSDPDQIPLPSVTPLTLNYSLYMTHAGTSEVTVEITPSGLVNAEMFNELKAQVEDLSLYDYIVRNQADFRNLLRLFVDYEASDITSVLMYPDPDGNLYLWTAVSSLEPVMKTPFLPETLKTLKGAEGYEVVIHLDTYLRGSNNTTVIENITFNATRKVTSFFDGIQDLKSLKNCTVEHLSEDTSSSDTFSTLITNVENIEGLKLYGTYKRLNTLGGYVLKLITNVDKVVDLEVILTLDLNITSVQSQSSLKSLLPFISIGEVLNSNVLLTGSISFSNENLGSENTFIFFTNSKLMDGVKFESNIVFTNLGVNTFPVFGVKPTATARIINCWVGDKGLQGSVLESSISPKHVDPFTVDGVLNEGIEGQVLTLDAEGKPQWMSPEGGSEIITVGKSLLDADVVWDDLNGRVTIPFEGVEIDTVLQIVPELVTDEKAQSWANLRFSIETLGTDSIVLNYTTKGASTSDLSNVRSTVINVMIIGATVVPVPVPETVNIAETSLQQENNNSANPYFTLNNTPMNPEVDNAQTNVSYTISDI